MSKEQQDITAAQILQFAEEYCQNLDKIKKKQPYHLNIIEELHINENAHSRILAKLLQYKDKKGKYVFLESLLEYIKNKKQQQCDFSKIKIIDPIITQEKKRIDLWVRTEKFAIIFENKVYDAKDQDAQISRYIAVNKKDYKYKVDSIYVVYLSSMGNEPDDRTWGKNGKRLKKNFQKRYINISFKYDIISWLKENYETILKKNGEKSLRAAIEQYIEYLEGCFMLGNEHGELQNFINKQLNLSNMDNVKKVESITKQINELEKLKEGLKQERVTKIKECFKNYAEEIRKKYKSKIESVNNNGVNIDKYPLYVKVDDKKPLVYIEVGEEGEVYCVIGYMRNKELPQKYNKYNSDDEYESYITFNDFNFKEIIKEFKDALDWVIKK